MFKLLEGCRKIAIFRWLIIKGLLNASPTVSPWEYHDAVEKIDSSLLESLLATNGCAMRLELRVPPEARDVVLLARETNIPEKGNSYWDGDLSVVDWESLLFVFEQWFDWDPLDNRVYEFVRVKIESTDPIMDGREALVPWTVVMDATARRLE